MAQLRIVFAGGPCAGKTTSLLYAEQIFKRRSINFLHVPETATFLFNCGIRLPTEDIAYGNFQKNLLKLQLLLEDTIFSAADERSVVVCDRGILDIKGNSIFFISLFLAYTKPCIWNGMLNEFGLDEKKIFSRYDAVVYFETAARYGPEKYVLNKSREMATATAQDAIEQDDKTKAAWSAHPNFYLIPATKDFDEKIKILDLILRAQTLAQGKRRQPSERINFGPALKVKKVCESAVCPKFQTEGAAGLDLYSNEEVWIRPGMRELVRTGISISLPDGYYGRIASRSGLSLKALDVGAGVIDSDYRGEICVLLINSSNNDYTVERGDRIAQLICEKNCRPEILEVTQLPETGRGSNGFGSTGIRDSSMIDDNIFD